LAVRRVGGKRKLEPPATGAACSKIDCLGGGERFYTPNQGKSGESSLRGVLQALRKRVRKFLHVWSGVRVLK